MTPRALVAATLLAAMLSPGQRLLVAQSPPPVKTASVTLVTAAYLLSFARFAEWPADVLASDASLVFCATEPAMADALREVVVKESIGAHALSVLNVQSPAVPNTCSVLYVSGLDARKIAALAPTLKSASMLSVGDSDEFMRAGGIIHLYKQDDMLRFTVNITAARRARLNLSSSLLSLASATILKE